MRSKVRVTPVLYLLFQEIKIKKQHHVSLADDMRYLQKANHVIFLLASHSKARQPEVNLTITGGYPNEQIKNILSPAKAISPAGYSVFIDSLVIKPLKEIFYETYQIRQVRRHGLHT